MVLLIDPDALECPLCAEPLDATELCLRLCECDYKICLFCYQRLVDDAAASASTSGVGGGGGTGSAQSASSARTAASTSASGIGSSKSNAAAPRCPNCRTPYDTARIDGQAPDPAE
jgi:RING/Ubox like zinc-binding domain